MPLRDKILGGGGCIAASWFAVWWLFHVEAAPIVKLLLFFFAFAFTAVIGGAVLVPFPREKQVSNCQRPEGK